MEARKISFAEAWETSTVFFVDEELEKEIDEEVELLLASANDPRISKIDLINDDNVSDFLIAHENSLEVILREIELSEEKFLRIITLLRKIKQISGGFTSDDSEWTLSNIKNKISHNEEFRAFIVRLLLDGKKDVELQNYIPKYYLEKLNYREIKESYIETRRIRYKNSLIGTYGGRKGYKVEGKIRNTLQRINDRFGIPFSSGNTRFIETNADFVVPSLDDPWVIIMSSFQETTSSGQTTKARDMLSAFDKITHSNSRYHEDRVFINFVDGGGWLARKRDFERLVTQCHYFLNFNNLDMLEDIVNKHVPGRYFTP